jgi:hypothetical protein
MSLDGATGGHATPTPAAHAPMHRGGGGGGKASSLDVARAVRPLHPVPGPVGHGPVMMGTSTPPNPNPVTNPEKNTVDVTKIEAGLDTRTTVMLKVCLSLFFALTLETQCGGGNK